MPENETNYLPWILGGCGCLLLLVLAGGAIGAVLYFGSSSPTEVREPEESDEVSDQSHRDIVVPVDTNGTNGTNGEIPRLISATVTSVTGNLPLEVDAICSFAIQEAQKPDGTMWCRSQVSCGTLILYGGGANNGYYDCTRSASPPRVTGTDTGTTNEDTDPSFVFDTQAGTLVIRDDAGGDHGAYTVTARTNVIN